MDWFKTAHGISTDPKWLVIARNAVTLPCVAFATWMSLLDYASQNRVRGSIEGFDAESAGAFLGIDQETIEKVISAFKAKGMIDGNSLIAKWNERQNKASDSAERVKRYRERKRNAVTLQPAPVHDVTAEEKRREESKEENTSCGKPHKPALPPGFVRFWQEWPKSERKVGKAKCVKRWRAHGLEVDAERIIADVQAKRRTAQWRNGYEPSPDTYLTQRRWEDGEGADGGDSSVPEWVRKGYGSRELAVAAGVMEAA